MFVFVYLQESWERDEGSSPWRFSQHRGSEGRLGGQTSADRQQKVVGREAKENEKEKEKEINLASHLRRLVLWIEGGLGLDCRGPHIVALQALFVEDLLHRIARGDHVVGQVV